jgi:hypothetical protein
LNSLSREGKLKAEKIGRNWYTKKIWLDEFLASDGKTQNAIFAQSEKTEEVLNEEILEASEVTPENLEEKKSSVFSSGEILEKISAKVAPKNNWMKIFASLSSVVIVLPLVFAVTFAVKNQIRAQRINSEFMKNLFSDDSTKAKIENENSSEGRVAAEETIDGGNGVVLASENFKVSDINIGGDIIILANAENQDLEIGNIKSESFISSKGDEVKLVVSWQTNKSAISELAYSKNSGQDPDVIKEESYGFSHSAVIPGLEQGTSYVYKINCSDHWANKKESDFFGIYTSSKPVSVFDLIANALGEVFGWAVKK